MAGQYRKKNAPRQRGNMLGQLLLVVVVFVAGYLTASLYDLASVTAWIGSQVLSNNSAVIIKQPSAQQASIPKPKFEFYTLLANDQAANAAPPASASAPVVSAPAPSAPPTATLASKALPLHAPLAPVAAVTTNSHAPVVLAEKMPALLANTHIGDRDTYLVQVGSFKNMQEAERMKVSLVMKGFDVKIAAIRQQNISWYRVIIGPFASRNQAQQAQMDFARREHIRGMIRKMDA